MSKLVRYEQEITGAVSTAEDVGYNNVSSGLEASNVQEAIDEVNGKFTNYEVLYSYGAFTNFNIDVSSLKNGDKIHVVVNNTINDIYYTKDLIMGIDLGVVTVIHPILIGGYYISASANGACFLEYTTNGRLKYNSNTINGANVNTQTYITCWVL